MKIVQEILDTLHRIESNTERTANTAEDIYVLLDDNQKHAIQNEVRD